MLTREFMKTKLYIKYRKLLEFDAENYLLKLKALQFHIMGLAGEPAVLC